LSAICKAFSVLQLLEVALDGNFRKAKGRKIELHLITILGKDYTLTRNENELGITIRELQDPTRGIGNAW
jgi:hypothetical protein